MTVDVTVIIPTRNRAASLARTLEALAAQQIDGVCSHEVLVADNGSTDETQALVKSKAGTFPVPLRCVYEGRPGTSPRVVPPAQSGFRIRRLLHSSNV